MLKSAARRIRSTHQKRREGSGSNRCPCRYLCCCRISSLTLWMPFVVITKQNGGAYFEHTTAKGNLQMDRTRDWRRKFPSFGDVCDRIRRSWDRRYGNSLDK